MFTRKIVFGSLLSATLLLGFGVYCLVTPDLLAFQTRVIAVREAYRNDQSIIKTLQFTEKMEEIRAKFGNLVDCRQMKMLIISKMRYEGF